MAENNIDYSLLLNIVSITLNPLIYWLINHQRKKTSITHQIIWKNAKKEKERLRAKFRMDIMDADLKALKKIAKIEMDKTKSTNESIQKEFINEVVDETLSKTTKLTENLKDDYINPLLEKFKNKKD